MKFAANWIIATAFSLIALAFLAVGGMSFLGRVFGRTVKAPSRVKSSDQLALDVKF